MDCGLGVPFICIQCGTDQNPCHIKVVGPTLGTERLSFIFENLAEKSPGFAVSVAAAISSLKKCASYMIFFLLTSFPYCLLARRSVLRMLGNRDRKKVRKALIDYTPRQRKHSDLAINRMLSLPVELNGSVSNAIPI